MKDTIEERVLKQTGVQPADEVEKQYLLTKIAEIISGKLMLACAQSFSDLEMSRMEYLLQQNDLAALKREVVAHIPDPTVLMEKIEADTVSEIKDLMKEIAAPAQ